MAGDKDWSIGSGEAACLEVFLEDLEVGLGYWRCSDYLSCWRVFLRGWEVLVEDKEPNLVA